MSKGSSKLDVNQLLQATSRKFGLLTGLRQRFALALFRPNQYSDSAHDFLLFRFVFSGLDQFALGVIRPPFDEYSSILVNRLYHHRHGKTGPKEASGVPVR